MRIVDGGREKEGEKTRGPEGHFLIIYAPLCGGIVRSRRINRGESPRPLRFRR